VWKLVGLLISVHRPVLFFSNVYRFPDPPVHSVAFSVDHLGAVPVYDVVEKDGVVCDCRLVLLCCCGFTGASRVSPYILAVDVIEAVPQKLYLFLQRKFCRSYYMVFYTHSQASIHIHRHLVVCACFLDVQADCLLSGIVSRLKKYHVVCKLR